MGESWWRRKANQKRKCCVTFWEMGAMALQIASHRVEGGQDAKEVAVASGMRGATRDEAKGEGWEGEGVCRMNENARGRH